MSDFMLITDGDGWLFPTGDYSAPLLGSTTTSEADAASLRNWGRVVVDRVVVVSNTDTAGKLSIALPTGNTLYEAPIHAPASGESPSNVIDVVFDTTKHADEGGFRANIATSGGVISAMIFYTKVAGTLNSSGTALVETDANELLDVGWNELLDSASNRLFATGP